MNPSIHQSLRISRLLRRAAGLATVLAFLLAASVSHGATYYYYIQPSVKMPGLSEAEIFQAMHMGIQDFGLTFGHTMVYDPWAHIHFVGKRLPGHIAGQWPGGRNIQINPNWDHGWDFNSARQIAWHEPCHALLGWGSDMHDHMGVLYAAALKARPNPLTPLETITKWHAEAKIPLTAAKKKYWLRLYVLDAAYARKLFVHRFIGGPHPGHR